MSGRPNVVSLMLSYPGIDINVRDGDGSSPLYWAVGSNNIDCVKLISNAGARINDVNNISIIILSHL